MASIKNYLVERIKSYVYHNYGNNFIRKFNILNKIYLKYPLNIGFLSNSNCYYANDNKGYKIFYSVPQRTERFKNGILNRLEYLYNEYIMDGCKINDGDIIIDVGANIGEFSMALNNKFKVQILAIEPEEKEYKCLKLNTENTNTISKQVALWNKKSKMFLYQKNKSNDSSLFEQDDYDSKIEIYTETLDNIIETEFGKLDKIKLLKLEAEGAEPEILEGLKKHLGIIEYISADVGPERGLKKETTLIQVNNILLNAGFELIGYYHKRGIVLYKNKSIGLMN